MKKITFLLIIVLLLSSIGCPSVQVPYVAVREAKFRSEQNKSERIKLPLTTESRKQLIDFLKAGGDTSLIGSEIADPEAEKHYEQLLNMLSDTRNLSLQDLTEKQTFKDWFSDIIIRQVIDAREEAPPIIDPVAVTDGKYWWIFYHRHKQLIELLVFKAIPREIKR
jgi:hypothetical protein